MVELAVKLETEHKARDEAGADKSVLEKKAREVVELTVRLEADRAAKDKMELNAREAVGLTVRLEVECKAGDE